MFSKNWNRSKIYRALFSIEEWVKQRLFGCHNCGQCVVRNLPFTCPQQCPKQMRNGPCGGSMNGYCEVYPDRICIWTKINNRADRIGQSKSLRNIRPAVDWSLYGTSAFWNLFVEKTIDSKGLAYSPAPLPAAKLNNLIAREQATELTLHKNEF